MAQQRKFKPVSREVRKGKEVSCKLLGFSKVYFIHHALVRMKERGITQAEVLDAIASPDETGLPTAPPRQRVRKRRNANVAVDVVYELARNGVRVITVIAVHSAGGFRTQRLAQRKEARRSKKR